MDEYAAHAASEAQELPEAQRLTDNPVIEEADLQKEYSAYDEYIDPEQSPPPGMNSKKKQRALSALSTGVVSSIVAVAMGITTMLNVSMGAEFRQVEYLDGQICYEVSVTDMTDKETLTAYLFKGEELAQAVPLTDDDGDGLIAGSIELDTAALKEELDSGNGALRYNLALRGVVGLEVERKFDNYALEISRVESRFEAVEGECHCNEDGCYHFRLNFTDDLQLFDNFSVEIEDAFGNTASCRFTENLHGEQTVFVGQLKGTAATLTLTYTVSGASQTETIQITI